MFAERGMAFANHRVIDRRTSAVDEVRLVRVADCVFLMGGDTALPKEQQSETLYDMDRRENEE